MVPNYFSLKKLLVKRVSNILQVTKSGKIVSEKTYRLKMAKKEHKDHVRDLLATAIVHKALDMEVRSDCNALSCSDSIDTDEGLTRCLTLHLSRITLCPRLLL